MSPERNVASPYLPSSAKSVRIFISTGEVSGDLQGSLLVAALKRRAEQMEMAIDILALGGDRMAQAGAQLLGHTSAIGSVGILESLPYILPTLQVQQRAKQYLQENPPDLVVMIDYLGPNLSIGSYVRQHLPQVPLVYYITPQEWVWSFGSRNTNQIINMADRILAIFPGEARYYQERGAAVTYVGHPLVDRMQDAPSREQARAQLGLADDQRAIALLPASRRQELTYLMPAMFGAAQQIQAKLPDVQFLIPLSLDAYRSAIEQAIQAYGLRATLIANQTQTVLAAADLAIAKSGTVNLELALLDVPQVVIYRVNPVTAWIAKRVLKFSIPFMSPPNLVSMEAIVPELLQDDVRPDKITQLAMELLLNPERRQQTLAGYGRMRHALGEKGVCDRAAHEIFALLVQEVNTSSI
ncbi:lipid-A-disaccharide synthase [Oculatella sp. LEGE 06141]|uniref:lipid-A-disaccharide synthase n=1 Tax=Oculatella sp. LEGE 06141 TaxID=1828648 RepID=UPI00188060CB|nr:lipid-A-disaccharide synthase [Oculatella sp. LEGE 06141]MBE9182007.1 lipid-A-disaccharide synthase [Oculatella sp. LEGE 06141]